MIPLGDPGTEFPAAMGSMVICKYMAGWESIEDPYVLAVDRSDEDAIVLALARDAELESGKVSPLSHAELMTRLRE